MKVCIAEKPSVAREIAQILGAESRKDGYFEGNGYQVTWTFGHLCSLKEPHEYLPEWKKWSLGMLPLIPSRFGIKLIDDKGIIKQFKIIEQLVQKAELVINCGDAGQEGEVIQRWVLIKAKCTCPVKRLWISSLTEEALRDGFANLRDGKEFDRLFVAGNSRAVGDWLLGINATRLYTLKYGQHGQVLSIGRVQTPTLALIVARQKEIDHFEPQPYWELKTVYRDVTFSNTEGRYLNKEEAEQALKTIRGKEFEITVFGHKKGNESPPRLFDLTSLQVECNKKFGFSAEETLKTIQALYEKKLTTYPRVDTTFLSSDIYPKVSTILKGLKPYEMLTASLLTKKIAKSKKVFDDTKITDHHAIIPTGQNPAPSLSRDEKLVFDLVARRFIAAFYSDSIVNTTTVEGRVENVNFKATGKQIVEDGWRVVFNAGKDAPSEENIIPEFVKGEHGPHEPDLQQKETQPPKPYTEATLLRAMETAGKQVEDEELRDLMKENGIGRPSTRAAIIETLFKRKYIARNRKSLYATVTGVQLIDIINTELIKSAELTGLWEKKLRDIERGSYDSTHFMQELKQMVSDIVFTVRVTPTIYKIDVADNGASVKKEKTKVTDSTAATVKCPRCGEGVMLKGKKAWGCSRFKEGCNTVIPFTFANKTFTDTQINMLLTKGKTSVIKGVEIDGEKVSAYIYLDGNFQLKVETEQLCEMKCPKCKSGAFIKGKSAYGCENFRKGCHVIIPFEFMGKKLTDKQVSDLLQKGKTGKLKGFRDAAGNEKNGRLVWNKNFEVMLDE